MKVTKSLEKRIFKQNNVNMVKSATLKEPIFSFAEIIVK